MKDKSLKQLLENSDWEPHKALLAWNHDSDPEYRYGFHQAAWILSKHIQNKVFENTSVAVHLIYPTMYCFRHYIELGLKRIIRTGTEIGLEHGELPCKGGHNLLTLWHKSRQFLELLPQTPLNCYEALALWTFLGNSWEGVDTILADAEQRDSFFEQTRRKMLDKIEFVIKEFDDLDQTSTALRYANSTTGTSSLGDRPFWIDAKLLENKIEEIGSILDEYIRIMEYRRFI